MKKTRVAWLAVPATGLVALVYLIPLALVLVDSFTDAAGRPTLGGYGSLLASASFRTIVWRTLRLAGTVTACCLVLGYPLAYVLARSRSRMLPLLMLLVTTPFFTSVLIRSYAWIVILGNNGLVNRTLRGLGLTDAPIRLVYNELGTVIGMTQVQLPLMVLTLYSIMRRIDRALVRAAQNLGASPAAAFWTVFRPLSVPGIVAGCSLVFASTLGTFVTPAMMGGPGQYMLAQAIEVRVAELNEGHVAAAQAMLLLAAIAVLIALFRGPLGLTMAAGSTVKLRGRRARALLPGLGVLVGPLDAVLSRLRRPLLAVWSALVLLYLVLPILVVVPLAFSSAAFLQFPPPGLSLRWFAAYLGDADWLQSTWFSLWLALASASVALGFGTAAALPLARGAGAGLRALHLVFVSPLIVPHIVIAVAMYFVLARHDLVGNPLSFIAAYSLFGLPYVILVMTSAFTHFDTSLERAAAALGASPARIWTSVRIPLLRPALASAFVFAFLVAFDDLVVSLFLSAPGRVTLPMRMWDDIQMEISPRIAAVAVVFFAVAAAALAAARLVPRFRRIA